MKLSTRSRYGVRLMLALGVKSIQGPVFLKDIARSEEISEKYLSQIIISLKAKGLVTPFRGAHGGYILGKPAVEIKLRDIIEPLEGDLCLVGCVTNSEVCNRSTECVTRDVWSQLSSLVVTFLENMTLEDLIVSLNKRMQSYNDVSNYSI